MKLDIRRSSPAPTTSDDLYAAMDLTSGRRAFLGSRSLSSPGTLSPLGYRGRHSASSATATSSSGGIESACSAHGRGPRHGQEPAARRRRLSPPSRATQGANSTVSRTPNTSRRCQIDRGFAQSRGAGGHLRRSRRSRAEPRARSVGEFTSRRSPPAATQAGVRRPPSTESLVASI